MQINRIQGAFPSAEHVISSSTSYSVSKVIYSCVVLQWNQWRLMGYSTGFMAIWICADNNEVTSVLHLHTNLISLIVSVLDIKDMIHWMSKVSCYCICNVIFIRVYKCYVMEARTIQNVCPVYRRFSCEATKILSRRVQFKRYSVWYSRPVFCKLLWDQRRVSFMWSPFRSINSCSETA